MSCPVLKLHINIKCLIYFHSLLCILDSCPGPKHIILMQLARWHECQFLWISNEQNGRILKGFQKQILIWIQSLLFYFIFFLDFQKYVFKFMFCFNSDANLWIFMFQRSKMVDFWSTCIYMHICIEYNYSNPFN